MKTLVLFLIIAFITFFASTCNFNDNATSSQSNSEKSIKPPQRLLNTDDPLPCCNVGKPTNCNPSYLMGLWCDNLQQDVPISCECCQEIYELYGNPPNLTEIYVDCTILGSLVCLPDE